MEARFHSGLGQDNFVPKSETVYSLKKHVCDPFRDVTFDLNLHTSNLSFILASLCLYKSLCSFVTKLLLDIKQTKHDDLTLL